VWFLWWRDLSRVAVAKLWGFVLRRLSPFPSLVYRITGSACDRISCPSGSLLLADSTSRSLAAVARVAGFLDAGVLVSGTHRYSKPRGCRGSLAR
jgi:hypothetical protein